MASFCGRKEDVRRKEKGVETSRKEWGRMYNYPLCTFSLHLHGPSHIETMTDLISHFATVVVGFWRRKGIESDSQLPAIKREITSRGRAIRNRRKE